MTRRTVELVDDLDPHLRADETVHFGLDGHLYQIDLTRQHAVQLRTTLARYMAAGRRLPAAQGRPRPSAADGRGRPRTRVDIDRRAVCAWARETGQAIPERGRIRPALYLEFRQATGILPPLTPPPPPNR